MQLIGGCMIERSPTEEGSVTQPSKRRRTPERWTEEDKSKGRHTEEAIENAPEICKEILKKPEPSPLQNLTELEARFLDEHNAIRRLYGLSDLTWDDGLAIYAQRWAEYLKANNRCKMKHRSHLGMREGRQYGENLAYNWISTPIAAGKFVRSPEGVVISWSDECKDYDYTDNSCKPNEQCGHYTQVIWKTTRRVGCGMVICDGAENDRGVGRVELWVCNYDPPGNWVGLRPY
jgi:uncharacterized protein YkwD